MYMYINIKHTLNVSLFLRVSHKTYFLQTNASGQCGYMYTHNEQLYFWQRMIACQLCLLHFYWIISSFYIDLTILKHWWIMYLPILLQNKSKRKKMHWRGVLEIREIQLIYIHICLASKIITSFKIICSIVLNI